MYTIPTVMGRRRGLRDAPLSSDLHRNSRGRRQGSNEHHIGEQHGESGEAANVRLGEDEAGENHAGGDHDRQIEGERRRIEGSAARETGTIAPFEGETDIFIYPGFTFRVADGLMTNFHLPKSTLMMLVSALMGRKRILRLYDHAIKSGYRFFSYGDASLLLP